MDGVQCNMFAGAFNYFVNLDNYLVGDVMMISFTVSVQIFASSKIFAFRKDLFSRI